MFEIGEDKLFDIVYSWTANNFLFGAIITFVGLIGIYLYVRVCGQKEALPHPACRGCGYIVAGIVSAVCPECAADLGGRGTLPPGTRRPFVLRHVLLVWTTCAACVAT